MDEMSAEKSSLHVVRPSEVQEQFGGGIGVVPMTTWKTAQATPTGASAGARCHKCKSWILFFIGNRSDLEAF